MSIDLGSPSTALRRFVNSTIIFGPAQVAGFKVPPEDVCLRALPRVRTVTANRDRWINRYSVLADFPSSPRTHLAAVRRSAPLPH
jgi:hypothetical protein